MNDTPAPADPEREEFEAFHKGRKAKGAKYRENLFTRLADGTYADDSVQRHWWTWQIARSTLTPSPVSREPVAKVVSLAGNGGRYRAIEPLTEPPIAIGALLYAHEGISEGRPEKAEQPDVELQEKIANNVWDHVRDVMPVVKAAISGEWQWFRNTDCKYIELRIDMRDGGCIVKNRNRERISIQTLKRQWPEAPASDAGDAK